MSSKDQLLLHNISIGFRDRTGKFSCDQSTDGLVLKFELENNPTVFDPQIKDFLDQNRRTRRIFLNRRRKVVLKYRVLCSFWKLIKHEKTGELTILFGINEGKRTVSIFFSSADMKNTPSNPKSETLKSMMSYVDSEWSKYGLSVLEPLNIEAAINTCKTSLEEQNKYEEMLKHCCKKINNPTTNDLIRSRVQLAEIPILESFMNFFAEKYKADYLEWQRQVYVSNLLSDCFDCKNQYSNADSYMIEAETYL